MHSSTYRCRTIPCPPIIPAHGKDVKEAVEKIVIRKSRRKPATPCSESFYAVMLTLCIARGAVHLGGSVQESPKPRKPPALPGDMPLSRIRVAPLQPIASGKWVTELCPYQGVSALRLLHFF